MWHRGTRLHWNRSKCGIRQFFDKFNRINEIALNLKWVNSFCRVAHAPESVCEMLLKNGTHCTAATGLFLPKDFSLHNRHWRKMHGETLRHHRLREQQIHFDLFALSVNGTLDEREKTIKRRYPARNPFSSVVLLHFFLIRLLFSLHWFFARRITANARTWSLAQHIGHRASKSFHLNGAWRSNSFVRCNNSVQKVVNKTNKYTERHCVHIHSRNQIEPHARRWQAVERVNSVDVSKSHSVYCALQSEQIYET